MDSRQRHLEHQSTSLRHLLLLWLDLLPGFTAYIFCFPLRYNSRGLFQAFPATVLLHSCRVAPVMKGSRRLGYSEPSSKMSYSTRREAVETSIHLSDPGLGHEISGEPRYPASVLGVVGSPWHGTGSPMIPSTSSFIGHPL
ncbi:hypothetical protein N656DRAFT_196190 [Canariomyces notabilis]|uniref:Uncharacterized protein n=1 Tax=Canariomyces notabilis TaxID=2074819 RepID=A0AAN6QI39_9PEZI|nr:hypothetical protein N656DRAFT_196190 [Canariomyces arenarius]